MPASAMAARYAGRSSPYLVSQVAARQEKNARVWVRYGSGDDAGSADGIASSCRWGSSPRKARRLLEEPDMKLSARNQIPARVTAINAGEATANVTLDAAGIRLVASITVEALHDLGL